MDLLEAFTEHWRGITGYYLEATGEGGAGSPCPGLGVLFPRDRVPISRDGVVFLLFFGFFFPGWGLCSVGIKSLWCGNRAPVS